MPRLDSRYLPLVLDAVDDGVFTVDGAGLITSFNRSASRITGYEEAEVIGRRCSEVFRSDLCDSVCPLRQSIRSRARIDKRNARIRTKEGRLIPIRISTAPLESPGGALLGGVEVFRDQSHLEALRRQLDGRYRFEDIVSRNAEMHRIFGILPAVARSDSTILVLGESGTGKELLAKAIHQHGPRSRRPFVAVNCAALPDALLESELFGYRKGAFTDAKTDRAGRVAQAEGGTLFLDEIGDLPRGLQVKLLRFLQEKSYEPLGASRSVRADVRVVAATHRDLEAMVREGSFRKDLFFRLNVLQITLPRLADRPEDVPLLARHFVARFREVTGKPIEGVSAAAMAALSAYGFPGNIRELENIIERAFILCDEGEIPLEVLPASVTTPPPEGQAARQRTMDQLEVEAIEAALARHAGNRTRAAADLGIHRVTLLRKLARGRGPAGGGTGGGVRGAPRGRS